MIEGRLEYHPAGKENQESLTTLDKRGLNAIRMTFQQKKPQTKLSEAYEGCLKGILGEGICGSRRIIFLEQSILVLS